MMKATLTLLALAFCLIAAQPCAARNVEPGAHTYGCTGCKGDPLNTRLPRIDKRYPTLRQTLTLLQARGAKTLVEIGTYRGKNTPCAQEGCSTLIFGKWAKMYGGVLYTVDTDAAAIESGKNACSCISKNVIWVLSDGALFLQNFNRPIDFLYIDSSDFDPQRPEISQLQALREVEAAYPHLTQDSVILVDDVGFEKGGRSLLVVPYLQERGWKVLMSGYQMILVRS